MTWAQFKATGSGTLRFAIVIEGWPDAWATDRSITYAPDNQTVRYGLSCEGILIQDRVIMQEARLEQAGNTFKIRPPARRQQGAGNWDDDATASFSRRSTPVAMCTTQLTAGSTTAPTIKGTSDLSNNTTYWLGSEAIRVGTSPTITRGYLSSIDQTHFIPTEPTDPPLYVWSYPPTMEGRRVYLYAWGQGDSGAAAGTLVWRGIVRRPPVLARDGVGWDIQCSSIADVLKQTLAGDIKTLKPVGIYHHSSCSIKLKMQYGADFSDPPVMLVGWDPDEASLFRRINDAIAAELVALGADAFVESLTISRGIDGAFRLELRTTSGGADEFDVELSSPIIGGVRGQITAWANVTDGSLTDGVINLLDVSTTYSAPLIRPYPHYFNDQWNGSWEPSVPLGSVSPLGYAHEIMLPSRANPAVAPSRGQHWQTDDPTDKANNPAWRMYVDQDVVNPEAVYIPGTAKYDGMFTITASGNDAARGYYIDIVPWFGPSVGAPVNARAASSGSPMAGLAAKGFMGFIDGSSEIRVRRNYGTAITVFTFMNELIDIAAAFGNKADTPFVTSEDCEDWDPSLGVIQNPAAMASLRDYVFFGPVALDAMLREELKLICYFPRISAGGRVEAVPLPRLTGTSPVSGANVITGADIITRAGSYGEAPTWEPTRDGRVTTVKYQFGYDPMTDEWVDPPLVFMDGLAVSLSKTRGKAVSEIKPYTHATATGLLPSAPWPPQWLRELATRFLTMFARDYDVVQLCVPFTKFDILCGDIVSVTHQDIPDGDGLRGLVGRRGVVIERSWPMDPAGVGYGKLTILLVHGGVVGYAPSAFQSAAPVNTSGTTWTLTCGAHPMNELLSTNGDNNVLEHFANGDYIRLVQGDSFTPTIVTGVVSGVPNLTADTIVVVLDGAWTPGASTWLLEFQDAASTAAQKRYAYVADDDLLLLDGSFARMFS